MLRPSNGGGDEFTLRLHGVGCHGARPHTGKDPILLAAKVIEGFQQIISRELDPLKALSFLFVRFRPDSMNQKMSFRRRLC